MKKLLTLLAVAFMAYAPVRADVVFDDFENSLDGGDNQNAIGETYNYFTTATDKYYDAGYWYAYDDSDDGGTSAAVPDYKTDKDFEGGLEQGGFGTQCLHINITLGTGIDEYNTAFYGIGANITSDGGSTDFSKMTSITFQAKGSGTMNFKFVTEQSDATGTWGDMVAPFKLTSDWSEVTIATSDIVPEPYSPDETAGLTWDDCKAGVEKMHFQTNGDKEKAGDKVDFWIDNIVIHGMDAADFNFDTHTVENEYPMTPNGDPIATKEVAAKKDVNLGNAIPNPFNPSTNLSFSVPTTQKVSLKVFDAAGNLIKTLYNGVTAGSKTLNWNATNNSGAKVASGVYFYRLSLANGKALTKSMVFVK